MNNQRFLTLAAGVAVICLLAACAGPPHIENFDATPPEEVPVAQVANGAIFKTGTDVALFETAVARRVGDTVTINLQENTAAQKSSSTTTSKSRTWASRTVDATPPLVTMPAQYNFSTPCLRSTHSSRVM